MPPKELPKILLKVLACPKCKGDLLYKRAQGKLLCNKCRLAFPIRQGIPIMLVSEAEKIK